MSNNAPHLEPVCIALLFTSKPAPCTLLGARVIYFGCKTLPLSPRTRDQPRNAIALEHHTSPRPVFSIFRATPRRNICAGPTLDIASPRLALSRIVSISHCRCRAVITFAPPRGNYFLYPRCAALSGFLFSPIFRRFNGVCRFRGGVRGDVCCCFFGGVRNVARLVWLSEDLKSRHRVM